VQPEAGPRPGHQQAENIVNTHNKKLKLQAVKHCRSLVYLLKLSTNLLIPLQHSRAPS